MSKHKIILSIFFGLVIFCEGRTDKEFTIEVRAGQDECFYETVQAGETIDVDYQVIDGGSQNDMSIGFRLTKPDGYPLASDLRKRDNVHRTVVRESGDYEICFDNTFNKYSQKLVFFELIVEKEGQDDSSREERSEEAYVRELPQDPYEEMVRLEIVKTLAQIHERMSQTKHYQEQLRNQEFRDRSIAERNFERVNFWSILQVSAMLVAGGVQVMLVRSLFDESSQLHGLWKRLC